MSAPTLPPDAETEKATPRAKAAGGPVPAPPVPCFVLFNIDAGAEVDTALPSILAALIEGNKTFCAYGGRFAYVRIGVKGDRDPHEIGINIRKDALTEAPDAAAYHTVTAGVPDIEVSLAASSSLLFGAESLSVYIDHEFKETLGDMGVNRWATGADGIKARAIEECDQVQNTSYAATNGVHLSNFLLESAFLPGASGPFDYLGVMASADDDSHGYAVRAQVVNVTETVGGNGAIDTALRMLRGASIHGGRIVHITGPEMSALQRLRKSSPASRSYRRGVRLSVP